MAREEIVNVVILGLLGVTKMSVEVSAGDVKPGSFPRLPLVWYVPIGLTL